jgi:acyl-CoA thioesterase-2
MHPADPAADRSRPGPDPTLLDVLALEAVDRDSFRSLFLSDDPLPLYGGQVAAQGLVAAGCTVPADRLPHSFHGYFLRSGDAARPMVFHVHRDRDGGSFSARRVVAVQGGEVVFSMAASFSATIAGPDRSVCAMPSGVQPPEGLRPYRVPRLASMEGRRPEQPFPSASWPTRFWARCTDPLPDDPLLHAAVLTYLSDISTGLTSLADDDVSPGSSLDHAVWFHRPGHADDWVLTDLTPRTVSGGRGTYAGDMFDRAGTLLVSFVQEQLFRPGANPFLAARGRVRRPDQGSGTRA